MTRRGYRGPSCAPWEVGLLLAFVAALVLAGMRVMQVLGLA